MDHDQIVRIISLIVFIAVTISFIFYRCTKGEDLFQSWFNQVIEKAREEGYREDQIEKFEQVNFFDHYYEGFTPSEALEYENELNCIKCN